MSIFEADQKILLFFIKRSETNPEKDFLKAIYHKNFKNRKFLLKIQ